VESWPSKT
jgi:hypothetical protein